MKTKAFTYLSSIILVSCVFLILTGSPILNIPLYKGSVFPWGTLVSWIGLIAFTFTIYLAFNKIDRFSNSVHRKIRIAFGGIVTLALSWVLIGFLLAGNWAFTFQNHDEFRGSIEASRYFWIFTASLVLLPVLLFLILWLLLMIKKSSKRSEQ